MSNKTMKELKEREVTILSDLEAAYNSPYRNLNGFINIPRLSTITRLRRRQKTNLRDINHLVVMEKMRDRISRKEKR